MTNIKAIHWFRQDLRLSDNPSLHHASKNNHVLPVYILDNENSGDLDLDYSQTQRININDKKASGVVSGYFNSGWLLKVELKNK